jgi:rhamnosyl/mannosyltransferase
VEARAAELRRRFRGPLLVGVGRLIYYKGFEYAVRAMRGVDATLLLVGDGPLRSSLEALARECGVADKVRFVGEVHNQEIMPYYLASDVFVFPSIARSEAFGIVQLEAMACALPVINTSLDSGVPFVSRHGETGLTVPPRDPEGLAAAIRDLLGDAGRRTAFGAAARRRVDREFRKEGMAARTRELYADVVARRDAAVTPAP